MTSKAASKEVVEWARWLTVILLAISLSNVFAADQVVISDDGRQIRLNGDGTWVQLSQDRYATTAQGQRVRLRPDGTWAVMDPNTPQVPTTARAGFGAPTNVASDVGLLLTEVAVLKRSLQRAKTTHAEVRTVYRVRVANHTAQALDYGDLQTKLHPRSNRGARFEIVAITPSSGSIAPGQEAVIEVIAQGGPRWFGVRFLSLEVDAGALGNPVKRILAKNMDEVERRDVERF
ncbi:MAG: hypothetical protein AAF513_02065 [Pseudomonadota bacterium]